MDMLEFYTAKMDLLLRVPSSHAPEPGARVCLRGENYRVWRRTYAVDNADGAWPAQCVVCAVTLVPTRKKS